MNIKKALFFIFNTVVSGTILRGILNENSMFYDIFVIQSVESEIEVRNTFKKQKIKLSKDEYEQAIKKRKREMVITGTIMLIIGDLFILIMF
ncbi:MAG: hypothetical protein FH753_06535 [Firmicutes bacterium]|nr:hypothetical protein [Bacillota bacterium]